MQLSFTNASITAALIASVILLIQGGDRTFPTIALVVSGVEALMAFGVMSMSFAKYRIDVILPALLLLAGGVCWARLTTKAGVTAATVITLVAATQLLLALGFT